MRYNTIAIERIESLILVRIESRKSEIRRYILQKKFFFNKIAVNIHCINTLWFEKKREILLVWLLTKQVNNIFIYRKNKTGIRN